LPAPRQYQGLPDLDYPFHDKAVTVTTCGRICFNRQKVNLSRLFAAKPSSSNKPKIGFGSSA